MKIQIWKRGKFNNTNINYDVMLHRNPTEQPILLRTFKDHKEAENFKTEYLKNNLEVKDGTL